MKTVATDPRVSIVGDMYIVTVALTEGGTPVAEVSAAVNKNQPNARKLAECVRQLRAQKEAWEATETARRAAQAAVQSSSLLEQVNA